jgi:hypothetical protein
MRVESQQKIKDISTDSKPNSKSLQIPSKGSGRRTLLKKSEAKNKSHWTVPLNCWGSHSCIRNYTKPSIQCCWSYIWCHCLILHNGAFVRGGAGDGNNQRIRAHDEWLWTTPRTVATTPVRRPPGVWEWWCALTGQQPQAVASLSWW